MGPVDVGGGGGWAGGTTNTTRGSDRPLSIALHMSSVHVTAPPPRTAYAPGGGEICVQQPHAFVSSATGVAWNVFLMKF